MRRYAWVHKVVLDKGRKHAAKSAGGGVVYLPRGTYFVNSSYGFTIPWGVQLKGEGKELVEIVFSETYSVCSSPGCRAKPGSLASGAYALFRSPTTGGGGWAAVGGRRRSRASGQAGAPT